MLYFFLYKLLLPITVLILFLKVGFTDRVTIFRHNYFFNLKLKKQFVSTRYESAFFFGLIAIFILLVRLPFLANNNELNVDESAVIGQAISIKSGYLIWKDINPSTAGPINTYVFLFFSYIIGKGETLSYLTMHLLALIIDITTLFILYKTGLMFFEKKAAQFSLFCTSIAYTLGNEPKNFFHYSSEKIPVLIICILLFLFLKQVKSKRFVIYEIICFGFIVGLSPFSKPQSVVIVGVISLCYLINSIYIEPKKKAKFLFLFLFGCSLFPLFITLYLFNTDGWNLLLSQLKLMSSYSNTNSSFLENLVQFYLKDTIFRENSIGTFFLLLFFSFLYYSKVTFPYFGKILFISVFVLSLAGIYTIIKTGYFFPHYYIFLIPLVFLLSAYSFYSKSEIIGLSITFLLICVYFTFDISSYIFKDKFQTIDLKRTEIGEVINKFKNKNDRLAVWGWEPKYFVETQLAQATSQNIVYFIVEGKHSAFFRKEYFEEIKKNKPRFFLDVNGTGTGGFQEGKPLEVIIPELSGYLQKNYKVIYANSGDKLYFRNEDETHTN